MTGVNLNPLADPRIETLPFAVTVDPSGAGGDHKDPTLKQDYL